jgi:hypothetical protein
MGVVFRFKKEFRKQKCMFLLCHPSLMFASNEHIRMVHKRLRNRR